jgi:hypothetical protein
MLYELVGYFQDHKLYIDGRQLSVSVKEGIPSVDPSEFKYTSDGIFRGDIYYRNGKTKKKEGKQNSTFLTLLKAIQYGLDFEKNKEEEEKKDMINQHEEDNSGLRKEEDNSGRSKLPKTKTKFPKKSQRNAKIKRKQKIQENKKEKENKEKKIINEISGKQPKLKDNKKEKVIKKNVSALTGKETSIERLERLSKAKSLGNIKKLMKVKTKENMKRYNNEQKTKKLY